MKTMWKKQVGIICAGGLLASLLTGCSQNAADNPKLPQETGAPVENGENDNGTADYSNIPDTGAMDNGNVADNGEGDNSNVPDDGAADSPEIPTQETQQNNVADGAQVNNNAADDGTSGSMGNGSIWDDADLDGSVVAFSDEGFTLSPATTETVDGGRIKSFETASSEGDENNIQITYTDNTTFQIVTFSYSSLTEISREDTDKESVKKQTSVAVIGSCQDTYHWTADKVMIVRWQ